MASVLVADHEPDVVALLRPALEGRGHAVSAAGSGTAALAAVRKHPPDVLVLDAMMPKLDGWGVLERLKSDGDPAVSTVRVIMLTARHAEDEWLRAGIEGALRCLTKPVDPDAVLRAVQDVLDGGPEPAQRKAVQHRSLARVAQMERRADPGPASSPARLGRMERERDRRSVDRTVAVRVMSAQGALTARQRELLEAVRSAPTVSAAAIDLGMSRSNLYACLRRVGRTLGVLDVSTVVRLARAGELADPVVR